MSHTHSLAHMRTKEREVFFATLFLIWRGARGNMWSAAQIKSHPVFAKNRGGGRCWRLSVCQGWRNICGKLVSQVLRPFFANRSVGKPVVVVSFVSLPNFSIFRTLKKSLKFEIFGKGTGARR